MTWEVKWCENKEELRVYGDREGIFEKLGCLKTRKLGKNQIVVAFDFEPLCETWKNIENMNSS